MTYRALLFACALVVGCGGKSVGDDTVTDGGTTTGDSATIPADGNIPIATEAGTVDYCKASADRAARCMSGAFSLDECQRQLACYRSALRPEAYTPLLTCFATRDCGTSDDKCVAKESQKFITDPVVSDWVKTCNEKRSACTGSFGDDYCGYEFGLMTDTLRANMKTCLSRSCAEVKTCFDTVFAALGCNN
jgi:hypothetical protein